MGKNVNFHNFSLEVIPPFGKIKFGACHEVKKTSSRKQITERRLGHGAEIEKRVIQSAVGSKLNMPTGMSVENCIRFTFISAIGTSALPARGGSCTNKLYHFYSYVYGMIIAAAMRSGRTRCVPALNDSCYPAEHGSSAAGRRLIMTMIYALYFLLVRNVLS